MHPLFVFASALFILAAAYYMLFMISEPLEKTGVRLGELLRVPEDAIPSTFQALASGPEIVIAIRAIYYAEADKACSGLLNMGFSAMANLVGIGCLAMI